MRYFFFVLFILGLIYLVWPGPKNINEISPLPESAKSREPGDTVQNPNIAAYFSQHRRDKVTTFYRDEFSYLNILGYKIPALRSNHPPEEAFKYIRDQQASTYLEQYYYPMRDSLYVNGFEPFDENGKPYSLGAAGINVDGVAYETKTTLRYYPSSPAIRVLVYILLWIGMIWVSKLLIKIIKNGGF